MHSPKRFFFVFIALIFSCFLFLSSLIYLTDPFGQRKLVTFFDPTYIGFYLSSLLQFSDYDSVLIGSSMTREYHSQDIKDLLGWEKPFLASSVGSSLYDISLILNKIEEHGFSEVLILIDYYPLVTLDENKIFGPLIGSPRYLYEKNGTLKTIKYLLDYSGTLSSVREILQGGKRGALPTSQWEEILKKDSEESRQKRQDSQVFFIRQDGYWHGASLIETIEKKEALEFPEAQTKALKSIKSNLIPYIQANPFSKFYITFSPYSALVWKGFNFQEVISVKMEIAKLLSSYSNVHFYDLSSYWEITSNLNNYADAIHPLTFTNQWFLKQLSKEKERITLETLNSYQEKLKIYHKKLEDYDIEKELKKYKVPLNMDFNLSDTL